MPSISMFYGLVIYMYVFDDQKHNVPHIHVKYQGEFSVISLPDGDVLAGNLPTKKLNLVKAWMTIHEEDLLADWDLAVNGELPHKLEPLK
ncbi:MAG: hypothetical protein A2X64_05040 [Ignavibacteria bacterium GWF2_33_9]|nr:MAG: hypothetical protein A2X64_05040 [Ignavibacteria bacterium GWF2_33_9]